MCPSICVLCTSPAIVCPDRENAVSATEADECRNSDRGKLGLFFNLTIQKKIQHVFVNRIQIKSFFDNLIFYCFISAIVACQTFCAEALRRFRSTTSFADFHF